MGMVTYREDKAAAPTWRHWSSLMTRIMCFRCRTKSSHLSSSLKRPAMMSDQASMAMFTCATLEGVPAFLTNQWDSKPVAM